MSVFARLQLNFPENTANSKIPNLSPEVISGLGQVPSFFRYDWQKEDLVSGNVGSQGYYRNPVANITNTIISICTSIEANSNGVVGLETITTTANTIYFVTAPAFFAHTERISGVVKVEDSELPNLPHYQTATAVGKALIYVLNQTDTVTNSAPIIGSMTSMMIGEELQERANTLNVYLTTIVNSLSPYITPPPDYETNLTSGQIQTIEDGLDEINTYLNTKRTHDETFFSNAQQVLKDFNTIKQYSSVGETETFLLRNYNGTSTLQTKLEI